MKKKITILIIILVSLGIFGSMFVGYSENKIVNTIKYFIPQSIKNFAKEKIFFVSNLKSKIFVLENIIKGQNIEIKYLIKQTNIQKKNIDYLLDKINRENNKIVSISIDNYKVIESKKGNQYKLNLQVICIYMMNKFLWSLEMEKFHISKSMN